MVLIPVLSKAEWIPLNNNKSTPKAPKVTLISDDDNSSVLKIELFGFDKTELSSFTNTYQKIDLLSESFSTEPGNPEVPYIAKVLAIPDHAGVSFEILDMGEVQTFDNIYLPPARKSWLEGSPETSYVENSDTYNSVTALPADYVHIDQPSVFRDFRISRVSLYPVRYIPAEKKLQVVSSLTVRVKYGPGEVVNPKTATKKPIAPSFGNLYKELLFNYQEVLNKSYDGKENGNELMLCIMPDDFVSSFQAYADWKRQSGMDIHVTPFSDIGANSTDPDIIKNHIEDAYHNWAVPPTYVLLVGDNGVFPKKTVSLDGWTFPNEDYFVEIDGNDFFPELFIGRLTNESDYGLQVMLNKFLKYEKTPYITSTDWFKKGICCSNDAYASQIDTKRFAASRMTDYGGFTVDTMMSDPGCTYDVQDVVAAINEGRTFLNYRGEGWSSGWWATCTPVGTSHISGLTNGEKLTFVTSIGCGVAMFNTSGGNCFGEEWLEIGTISSPKGAVAFVGPTSNTHTTYNNKLDKGIYVGMFQDGNKTPGQALARGRLYLYNVFGSDPMVEYHYKVYCILGDPSVRIWKDVPEQITVHHPPVIPFGSNLVDFYVTNTSTGLPLSDALVCVTGDNTFATGFTDTEGIAHLDLFSEIEETLTVTVTGGNVIPYTGSIDVVQPTGPYVIRDTHSLNDIAGGNGNGFMDFGESILMSLTVKNVGTQQADDVEVTLSTTDSYITFTDNFHNYGNIAAGQSVSANDVFAFDVADNLPDQHTVVITVSASSTPDTWNTNLSITGNAPVLNFGSLTVYDPTGNDNGRLDPGETADIIVPVLNNGHSPSPASTAGLTSVSPWITINSSSSLPGIIPNGGGADAVFNITCDAGTPLGTPVDLIVDVIAGNYGISNTFYQPVGIVLEDWETGDFSNFPWTFGGDANWAIVNAEQYEGQYTAISGSIENNETSELILDVYVTSEDYISFYRKVSSENNYDYLKFYIDGTLQDQWAGNVAWGQESYLVTAGIHTFKWVYDKDQSQSHGSDCAWVDYIVFPPIAPPPDPAEIVINPSSFEITLSPDNSLVKMVNIANAGETQLDFSLTKTYLADGSKAYCSSSGGGNDEFIENVTVGSINNTTGQTDYGDYTNLSTIVDVGQSYPIIITNGDLNWSSDQCGIWVDWNQDEDFTNDGFITVTGSPGVGPYTADIVPPITALPGPTRIRIQIIYNQTPDPCISSFSYGEVEDYTLVVNNDFTDWLTFDPTSGSVAGSENTDISLTFDATGMETGDYYANINISSNDPVSPLVIVPCTLHVAQGIMVDVSVFLEGPFVSTEMSTSLNSGGFIPMDQPFNVEPWYYNGNESVASIPNNDVVDWVLVELRETPGDISTAGPANMVGQKAGFLLKDGSVVATDGSSLLNYGITVTNNLFLIVYHRNHVGVISASPVPIVTDTYVYDFTTASDKAFGGNKAHKLIAPGTWGMVSGDGLCDGQVNNVDKNDVWENENGSSGYHYGDLNLDGTVDVIDKIDYWEGNSGRCTYIIK